MTGSDWLTVLAMVFGHPIAWLFELWLAHVGLIFAADRLRRWGRFRAAITAARLNFWLNRAEFRAGRLFDRLTGTEGKKGLGNAAYGGYAAGAVQLADVLTQAGELDEAVRLTDTALEVGRSARADDEVAYAVLLTTRGGLAALRYDAAAARPLLERALAIHRKRGKDTTELAGTLLNLGTVYQAMGEFPTAARAYEDALSVFSRARFGRELVGTILTNLGTLAVEAGDLDRAGDYVSRAVEHVRRVNGPRHTAYASALLNLAVWHERRREFPQSLAAVRECLAIREAVLGKDHPGCAHALNNLAHTLTLTGEYDEARAVADRALAGRLGFGEDHPLATYALGTRAVVDAATGRPRDALDRLREVDQTDRRVIARIFAVASDGERLSYLAKVRKRVFYFLSLVYAHLRADPQAVAAALDLVLTRKALAAEATAARRDAVLGGRYPEQAGRLADLTELRRRIAALTLAGPGPVGVDAHRIKLNHWRRQQTELEVELSRSIPEVGLEARLREADHRAVAAALPPGGVLVEFARFDVYDYCAVPARGDDQWKPARYVAFVLSRGEGPVAMIDLGWAAAIDGRVRAFRAGLLGRLDGGRGMVTFDDDEPAAPVDGPGAALRELVFDPLRVALGGAEHVILAPDGELSTVPFEVLPDADGRPLVEARRFSYLAVGRDLLRGGGGRHGAGAPLVVASPAFDLGSAAAAASPATAAGLSRDLDRSALRFPPLPGTEAEGRAVAAALGVPPALGEAAVEERVRAAASPRVLHLATHGFFLPDQPGHPEARLAVGAENPLLRSGLALAGANTWLAGGTPPAAAGDGLLTAEDVTGLDLLGTELVVLSACETGLGDVKAGEGVFGLRRAFQLAGARAVVMSLWKVPDEATRELMTDFYRRLLAGVPRAQALRQAQLALRARYPDPRDWGGFILQGDAGPLGAAGLTQPNEVWVRPEEPSAAVSPYRVVYDVSDDNLLRTVDRILILAPVAMLAFLVAVFGGRTAAGYLPVGNFLRGMVITPLLAAAYVAIAFAVWGGWVRDQRRCRGWRRAGEYETAEGVVDGYEMRQVNTSGGWIHTGAEREVTFRVGGQTFTLTTHPRRGGLRLSDAERFGDHTEFIWDGKSVRVAHRDGRVLRVEAVERYASLFPDAPPAPAFPRHPHTKYVRVFDPPGWPMPPEINRAWVGVELPIAAGPPGAAASPTFRGDGGPSAEYAVDAPAAIERLTVLRPWAAKWWREAKPEWCEPGSRFTFPATVCQPLADDPSPAPVPAPVAATPSLAAPAAATRSAAAPADPTFDPPRQPRAEPPVPSFLGDPDPPPPPTPGSRLRKRLVRGACIAYAIVLGAAALDYSFGGGVKGFGPWVFAATGWLGGAVFVRLIPRINNAVGRGQTAGVGQSAREGRQQLVGLLFGVIFSLGGVWIIQSAVRDLPDSASPIAKRRHEADRQFLPVVVGPLFLFFGGAGFSIGGSALVKLARR